MLELLRTPDLAAEITLQPVTAFDLDAAIVFSDILIPLDGLGLGLRFEEGQGPILECSIRSAFDVHRARERAESAVEALRPTLETIDHVRRTLEGRLPLIGFAGAPFTLAVYSLGGGSGQGVAPAHRFALEHPSAWQQWLETLASIVSRLLVAQIQAGANAVQLFDTWAGALDPPSYRCWALPATVAALQAVKRLKSVPVILFAGRSAHLLDELRQTGADVISIGSDIPLDEAWRRLGPRFAVQGNLDPQYLLGPRGALLIAAQDVLRRAAGQPGHIFNLAHGIPKETDPAQVRDLVEFVHTETRRTSIAGGC